MYSTEYIIWNAGEEDEKAKIIPHSAWRGGDSEWKACNWQSGLPLCWIASLNKHSWEPSFLLLVHHWRRITVSGYHGGARASATSWALAVGKCWRIQRNEFTAGSDSTLDYFKVYLAAPHSPLCIDGMFLKDLDGFSLHLYVLFQSWVALGSETDLGFVDHGSCVDETNIQFSR